MTNRKKILVVTRNMPPLTGGMERLNWHLADELSKRFDVSVVGPSGAAKYASPKISVQEAPLRPLSRFLMSAFHQSVVRACRERPDLVIAGSGLTAPIAWSAARVCGARCATYVHGLDIVVPHPVYQAIWMPFLRRMDGLIANSSVTAGQAAAHGISADRVRVIHPGVLPPKSSRPEARMRFRSQTGLDNSKVLLSVGRLTGRKGLEEFVVGALPRIVAGCPDTKLVIIGDEPGDALHGKAQTRASIERAATIAGVQDALLFLGSVSEDALDDAYWGADVHVFPVRDIAGDPEGFGMVAIEAAAHGLPTVAYAVGGVIDAVRDGESGRLIRPGAADHFADAVVQQLMSPISPERILAFAEQFFWPKFGQRISRVAADLITGTHDG